MHALQQVDNMDWSSVEFITHSRRPMRRHRSWGVGVCVCLTLPLVVSSLIVWHIYVIMAQVTSDTFSASQIAEAMSDRTVGVGVGVARSGAECLGSVSVLTVCLFGYLPSPLHNRSNPAICAWLHMDECVVRGFLCTRASLLCT